MGKKIKVKLKLILFQPAYDADNKQVWQTPARIRAYETVDVKGLCIYRLDEMWRIGHIKSGTAITKIEWDNIKAPLEMITEWLNEINWDKEATELRKDKAARQAVENTEDYVNFLIAYKSRTVPPRKD